MVRSAMVVSSSVKAEFQRQCETLARAGPSPRSFDYAPTSHSVVGVCVRGSSAWQSVTSVLM